MWQIELGLPRAQESRPARGLIRTGSVWAYEILVGPGDYALGLGKTPAEAQAQAEVIAARRKARQ